MVEQAVTCFQCEKGGHKKWECMEKKETRRKEVVLRQEVWEKVKEHCRAKRLPLRGMVMSIKGWMTKCEVITLVECRRCDYKGTKIQENQGQSFLGKEQLYNMWCGGCKEAWNWREEEAKNDRAERMKCSVYGGKNVMTGKKIERNKKGEVFCPPCTMGKKVPWWNWGSKVE